MSATSHGTHDAMTPTERLSEARRWARRCAVDLPMVEELGQPVFEAPWSDRRASRAVCALAVRIPTPWSARMVVDGRLGPAIAVRPPGAHVPEGTVESVPVRTLSIGSPLGAGSRPRPAPKPAGLMPPPPTQRSM